MCCSYTYWNVLCNADIVDTENSRSNLLRVMCMCVCVCVCVCVGVCVSVCVCVCVCV